MTSGSLAWTLRLKTSGIDPSRFNFKMSCGGCVIFSAHGFTLYFSFRAHPIVKESEKGVHAVFFAVRLGVGTGRIHGQHGWDRQKGSKLKFIFIRQVSDL